MSQFDLIDVPSSNESVTVGSETRGKVVCKRDKHEIDSAFNVYFYSSGSGVFGVAGVFSPSTSYGKLFDSGLWTLHL